MSTKENRTITETEFARVALLKNVVNVKILGRIIIFKYEMHAIDHRIINNCMTITINFYDITNPVNFINRTSYPYSKF